MLGLEKSGNKSRCQFDIRQSEGKKMIDPFAIAVVIFLCFPAILIVVAVVMGHLENKMEKRRNNYDRGQPDQ